MTQINFQIIVLLVAAIMNHSHNCYAISFEVNENEVHSFDPKQVKVELDLKNETMFCAINELPSRHNILVQFYKNYHEFAHHEVVRKFSKFSNYFSNILLLIKVFP